MENGEKERSIRGNKMEKQDDGMGGGRKSEYASQFDLDSQKGLGDLRKIRAEKRMRGHV